MGNPNWETKAESGGVSDGVFVVEYVILVWGGHRMTHLEGRLNKDLQQV